MKSAPSKDAAGYQIAKIYKFGNVVETVVLSPDEADKISDNKILELYAEREGIAKWDGTIKNPEFYDVHRSSVVSFFELMTGEINKVKETIDYDESKYLTADEYYDYLCGYNGDESPIPLCYVRDEHSAHFATGGVGDNLGTALCRWHNGMDYVYAAGSQMIGNGEVQIDTLVLAHDMLKSMLMRIEKDPESEWLYNRYDAAELRFITEFLDEVINAKPSEEPQYFPAE